MAQRMMDLASQQPGQWNMGQGASTWEDVELISV